MDPEIIAFVKANYPESLEAIEALATQEPDLVLNLYLEDQLQKFLDDILNPRSEQVRPKIDEVRDYIGKRYNRFLEYADYHSTLNGLPGQGGDVLNEVLLMALLKDEEFLIGLYERKKQHYREIDFFILRMIKLNCSSLTSPYRHKYRVPKPDANANTSLLDDESNQDQDFAPEIYDSIQADDDESIFEEFQDSDDQEIDDEDPNDILSQRLSVVRDIVESLNLSSQEKEIFFWKFFLCEKWTDWKGKESIRQLRTIYRSILDKVISEVQARKEQHSLSIIRQCFRQSRGLSIRISEAEFLLLRQFLSEQKTSLSPDEGAPGQDLLKVVTGFEKRLLLAFNEKISDLGINSRF